MDTVSLLASFLTIFGFNIFKPNTVLIKMISITNLCLLLFALGSSVFHLTTRRDMIGFGDNLIAMTVTLLTTSKILTIYFFAQDIKHLILVIKEDLSLYVEDLEIHRQMDMTVRKIAMCLFTGMTITIAGYSFIPIFITSQFGLPMAYLGSLVPNWIFMGFWINYGFELWIQFICLSITTSYDGFFLYFTMQACTHLDGILEKLNGMQLRPDRLNYMKDIERLHKHHVIINKFVSVLSTVFHLQLLTQYVSSMGAICAAVYNTDEGYPIIMVIFSLTAIGEIFMFSLLGQMLKDKSEYICRELYLTNWEDSSKVERKAILFMLTACQKPLLLSTGFVDLNLESFLLVIKTAYSFYALLKSMSAGN